MFFRMGDVIERSSRKDPKLAWITLLPKFLVPNKLMTFAYLSDFYENVQHFGKDYAFKDLPQATKIYFCLGLAVKDTYRGLGLGKELIQRSNDIAKTFGCSHAYVEATSIYSQVILEDLDFEKLHEHPYEKFKRKDGSNFFTGMKEHKVHQVMFKDLRLK